MHVSGQRTILSILEDRTCHTGISSMHILEIIVSCLVGVVNLTPPMEDLNVDPNMLNETITISVSNDGPVGSNPDVDNSVVSLLSSKKSIPFPVRPSSTLFKKADKENMFRVPTSKTVKLRYSNLKMI